MKELLEKPALKTPETTTKLKMLMSSSSQTPAEIEEGSCEEIEDGIEIVESKEDLRAKLIELTKSHEKKHASMAEQMRLLLTEMDAVLQDRSDSERANCAVRRKMERSLLECQDIIDRLGRDLKASETAMLKVRGDLRVSQERCATLEEKHSSAVNAMQEEKKALNEKITELIESYSKLQRICEEEKAKTQSNAYLKDYIEYLEAQIKTEKAKNEQNDFKDKVISQLNSDHALAILQLKFEQQETLQKLKAQHEVALENARKEAEAKLQLQLDQQKQLQLYVPQTTTNKSDITLKRKQLAICSSSSSSLSSLEEDVVAAHEDEENQLKLVPVPSPSTSATSTPSQLKAIPPISSAAMTMMMALEHETNESSDSPKQLIKRLQACIAEWEDLFRTLDIDTYLTQLEIQVDDMHMRNLYTPRNDILKEQVEFSLRGIRQLCDYHCIDMEYTI